MRRTIIALLILTGLMLVINMAGQAQDKKPDATIELSEGQVAVGIG